MLEPNRLSAPGEAAARARVEVVFAAIDETTPQQLSGTVISRRHADQRARQLETLEGAVVANRRNDLLANARERVRNALHARMADVLPAGTYLVSTSGGARVDDRVEVFAAIDDAVAVAVAEDLLEPGLARMLAGPGRDLLGLEPLPGGGGDELPDPVWSPSASDWADAEQAAGIDQAASMPGTHLLRMIVFGGIALFGIPTAIFWGVATDQPVVGVLVGLAIGALCWTFATFRRAA